jgi:hypothetical protein
LPRITAKSGVIGRGRGRDTDNPRKNRQNLPGSSPRRRDEREKNAGRTAEETEEMLMEGKCDDYFGEIIKTRRLDDAGDAYAL